MSIQDNLIDSETLVLLDMRNKNGDITYEVTARVEGLSISEKGIDVDSAALRVYKEILLQRDLTMLRYDLSLRLLRELNEKDVILP